MASYGDDVGMQDWLDAQGLTLPDESPTIAVLRQIGSNYVDAAYEWRLQCSSRTGGFSQELAWPRTGHTVNGQSVPDDLIPQAWVYASYRAGYLQAMTPGWATTGINGARMTKREKADVVEREFFSAADAPGTDAAAGMPSDSIINGMILGWLCSAGRSLNSLFRVI